MKFLKFSLLTFFFFCACTPAQYSGGSRIASIQIKGSDTIVNLIQAWTEKNPVFFNVSVTGGGSGTGFASLINDTCDIAMSSRLMEEKEKILAKNRNVNIVGFNIGLDGLAVLVNKNNPVNELTLDQLRDIFMAKITNWKEVGGEDRKIVILSRESNSGTHVFFKERVLRRNNKNARDEFAVQSLMLPSSQTIYYEVYQNPNALGYVGMGFVNDKVKAVSIAINADSKYVFPTPENVINGTYLISRPLYLYTNGNPQGVVKMFIDYALSDAGQKIVLETDFVPFKI
ncbi:MAG: phosphate ABC transporter substrate-binding protein [Endomicrobium sp.]|jgi:phosphate transport system substrate-binding protein|nr:phosphate ABC transporter substrate-binding protein [Endomicrobium sp.]